MTKSELRKICLEKQKRMSAEARSEASRKIAESFFENFDLAEVRYLHCFLRIEKFNEINTRLIIEKVWRDFPSVQIVVPRVDFETNQMTSLKFDSTTALARNAWHIDEPTHDDLVETSLIDMVLVPGVCFDRSWHRVGYGKGFYDRFLARCRPDCVKIGLSYWDPVDVIDDVHEGDVRLDLIIEPR